MYLLGYLRAHAVYAVFLRDRKWGILLLNAQGLKNSSDFSSAIRPALILIYVAQLINTRTIGNGPRNFEPRSSDEMIPEVGQYSPNNHANRKNFLQILRVLASLDSGFSVTLGLELMNG
ncbi:hypothetical protein TNCV_2339211 [Trichonephila clavipes]|nr:hypothetical protein TNCV_2339211 [Trichonephila clavipes]